MHHQAQGAPPAAPRCMDVTNPLLTAVIALVAGPLAASPMAGRTLHRLGHRALGWAVGGGSGLAGIGLFLGLYLWRTEQCWVALTLLLAHVACAGTLALVLAGPCRRHRLAMQMQAPERGTYRQILAGMSAGALLSTLLGVITASLYLLTSDRLMSTLMPVAFEDEFTLFLLSVSLFPMVTAGVIGGGLLGWLRPRQGRPGCWLMPWP